MSSPSLLVAAFPPELGGLDGGLPQGWSVAVTGIGSIAAAVETTRLLAARDPRRVLFVGTCGAYDDRLPVGAIFAVSRAIATSIEEVEGRAYRPDREVSAWTATWTLPLPAHDVAVTPAITTSEAGARVLSRVAAAEHLELTGVFAACAAAGVPVAGVLGVANRVGPGAHAEWLRENRRVSAALADLVRPLLAAL